jgi:two-component system, cell cycle response regulator
LYGEETQIVSERVSVLLVGLDEAEERLLQRDDAFSIERAATLEAPVDVDALVVAVPPGEPLEALRNARRHAPEAAIVAVTAAGNDADGTVAIHAGAEDHLVRDDALGALLPRAVRYAVAIRRMRRELETVDPATTLPNLRGFGAIAEHHLRMADRAGHPIAFVFVRLAELDEVRSALGPDAADELARDAAAVLLRAVRDSDVPARIAPDTFCVLLTGSAEGAEATVLSRLVEAMAEHDAGSDRPRLGLAVGSARYRPGSGGSLGALLEEAARSLSFP